MIVQFFRVITAFACTFANLALGVSYSNAINGNGWQTSASVFECRMQHQVPFLGKAVFSTRAGEASRFYVSAKTRPLAAGGASILVTSPLWKKNDQQRLLVKASTKANTIPIRLASKESELMLDQLQQGHELVFVSDVSPGAMFKLSSIGFRPSYMKYLNCLSGLLPANFHQLKRTALYFDPASGDEKVEDELSDANKRMLDRVLKLVKHDRRINRFYIDGHTSSPGDREDNLELSKLRAGLVADYLKQRGVPEDSMVVRWHGERYPVASNESTAGRAKNRRVTLRLERIEKIDVLPVASKP